MQNLKPTIDNIKRLYGDDKDKVQRETTALYEKAGVKPLAGEAPPTPQTAPSMPVCASTLSNRTLLMPPLAALLPHQPAPCVLAAQASPDLGTAPATRGSLLCPLILCWHWLLVPSCSSVDDCTGSTFAVVCCRLPALTGHHPHLHRPVPVPVQCGQQRAARHRGLLLAALPGGTHHVGSAASRWAHLRAEGGGRCSCAKQPHAALTPHLRCIQSSRS